MTCRDDKVLLYSIDPSMVDGSMINHYLQKIKSIGRKKTATFAAYSIHG